MQKEVGWLLKEKYQGKKTKGFYEDIKRLNAGEPLDYVIGFTEFLGFRIDLSEKPLIPRPETEFWVGQAIETILAFCRMQECVETRKIKILDIFAGSGCIGIAISRHVKNAKVDFADKYKYFDSPNFIKSDVFSNIKGKYDYIFANPPYIPQNRKSKVGESVLKFEPKSALFGGKDGFFYIRKFLKQAKNYLNPSGRIFMEFSPEQKKEIGKIIKKNSYKKYEFHRDQYGRYRWLVVG